MPWAAAAVVGAAVISSESAKDEGKKNRRAGERAQDSADQIANRELELAEEQWASYERNILPLEIEAQSLGVDAQELAQRRGEADFKVYNNYYRPLQVSYAKDAQEGIEDQSERVARDAADTVDQQYNRDRDVTRRSLERKGVRPDSGNYKGTEQQMSFSQAASRSNSMNIARENEFDRVENTNFNRKSVALGRTPLGSAATQSPGRAQVGPASANALFNGAANGFGQSANRYNNLANQNNANSRAALAGGITAGANVYSQFRNNNASAYSGSGWTTQGQDFSGGGAGFGGYSAGSNAEFANFADGGPVLKRDNPGGEVSGPAGYDKVPAKIDSPDGNTYDARLTDGEYVIPVDVVMAKGTDFFDDLLQKYHTKSSPNKALSRRLNS